jgi:hypothetical protein
LKKYGLEPDALKNQDIKFGARMYEPDPSCFPGDVKPTLAFKGTDSPESIATDVMQAGGLETSYYARANDIGNTVRTSKGGPVDFTGHSLGGGLAATAAESSGGQANTFNAAGVHSATLGRSPSNDKITNYTMEGEPLTSAQNSWLPPGPALGTQRVVKFPPVSPIDETVLEPDFWPDHPNYPAVVGPAVSDQLDRHSIDTMEKGLRLEREANQRNVEEALGNKC